MDGNRALLEHFFTSLVHYKHQAMAECYATDATFTDIAFDLSGKKKIHAMWHMITAAEVCVTYDVETCDQQKGVVRWVADYVFKKTGRPVHNELRSSFVLRDGLIVQQRDDCDARKWCMQALGPIMGPLAWLIPQIRQKTATDKLDDFIRQHRQYQ
jgi:ketosteroid isomerase-like protein